MCTASHPHGKSMSLKRFSLWSWDTQCLCVNHHDSLFPFFTFFFWVLIKKKDSVNKNRNTCYLKVVSLTLTLIVFRHVLIRNVCSKRLFCWLLWWYVNRWHWLFFFFFCDLVKYVVTTKSHFKEEILFPDILKKGFISLGLCSKASCPTLKWFPGFSI